MPMETVMSATAALDDVAILIVAFVSGMHCLLKPTELQLQHLGGTTGAVERDEAILPIQIC